MVEIKNKGVKTTLQLGKRVISFELDDWNVFKDNLIIDYNEQSYIGDNLIDIPFSAKIKPEELTYSMFNCLVTKHEANYNDKTQRRLNVNRLKTLCHWEID
jgi:hypothetical protein